MKEPRTFERIATVVEAIQWTGDNRQALNDFGCTTAYIGGTLRLFVAANQTWLSLEVGEWIASDQYGYYPIKGTAEAPINYREIHHCKQCGCTWSIDGPSPCPECGDQITGVRITDKGCGVVESGLTVRQAHELEHGKFEYGL